ncbi:MAG: type II secretion system F family protein [Acidimicrobiia bacterium]|nr:type II secretion system F family protein [Acidimicrobiia bacterium]
MTWLAVTALVALAVVLVLTDPPAYHDAEDVAAAGWTPAMFTVLSAVCTLVVAVTVFALVAAATGSRAAPAVGVATGMWMPLLLPPRLRRAVLDSHSRRQADALHSWLRRVRLYTAIGMPLRQAAVEAAHQTTERAFTPVASAIATALEAGRDPLTAAAQRVSGSAAETLLGTVDTVERSGAASGELIDHVMDRAIAVYGATAAERTDRLGRTTATLGTIIVAVAVALLMFGIAASINTGAVVTR